MEKKASYTGWLVAAGILLIIAVVLAVTNKSNKTPMVQDGPEHTSLKALFTDADKFERLAEANGAEVYRATGGDAATGYAVIETVQGYGGPIVVTTAMRQDGTVTGLQVGGSQFNETEGLGAKAREKWFAEQFVGKKPPIVIGEDIDGIAGATVTTKAVVDAVNHAQKVLASQQGGEITSSEEIKTANASAIGYGGPVLVRLSVDADGRIAAMDVGGVRFMETEGVGSRVKEDAFVQQFIGLTPPLTPGEDIDTLSGATISSRAVIEAVNDASAFLTQDGVFDTK